MLWWKQENGGITKSQVGRESMAVSGVLELHSNQFKQVEERSVTSDPFPFAFLKAPQKSVTEGPESPTGRSASLRAPGCGEPTGLPGLRKTLSSVAHTHRCHSLPSSWVITSLFTALGTPLGPHEYLPIVKDSNSSQIQISSRME